MPRRGISVQANTLARHPIKIRSVNIIPVNAKKETTELGLSLTSTPIVTNDNNDGIIRYNTCTKQTKIENASIRNSMTSN